MGDCVETDIQKQWKSTVTSSYYVLISRTVKIQPILPEKYNVLLAIRRQPLCTCTSRFSSLTDCSCSLSVKLLNWCLPGGK